MFKRILFCLGMAGAIASQALGSDIMSWEVNGAEQFGSIDLNTGVFTITGSESTQLSGLGVSGGMLFGGGYAGNTLFSINTSTGALTSVGTGSITYNDFGSTLSGLYAIGSDGDLYSINAANGASTLIGSPGLSINSITTGLSTNSSTLYYSVGGELYTLNTTTGAATPVGATGNSGAGAMVFEAGSLWAGVNSPLSVETLNTSTGTATPGATVSGTAAVFWGLAPDPVPSSAPEPSTWLLLASSPVVLLCLRRFRFRRN
jgi:hypothetical protein